MKRYFMLAFLMVLCLILPGTVFHFWSWAGIKPDLAMLLVIYLSLHYRPVQGIAYGFAAGLLIDLYIGRYIGLHAITLVVVALLISFLQKRWYRENIPLTMVMVFLVTVLGQGMMVLLAGIAGLNWFFGDAVQVVFGIALYNTLLVPLTYPLLHRSFTSGILHQKGKFEQG